MIAVLCLLRRPELIIRLRGYLSIRPIWSQIRRILYLGIPSGIENSMFQFGKLAIQSTVSMMGTATIVGNDKYPGKSQWYSGNWNRCRTDDGSRRMYGSRKKR